MIQADDYNLLSEERTRRRTTLKLPGGQIQHEEDPKQALRREIGEELSEESQLAKKILSESHFKHAFSVISISKKQAKDLFNALWHDRSEADVTFYFDTVFAFDYSQTPELDKTVRPNPKEKDQIHNFSWFQTGSIPEMHIPYGLPTIISQYETLLRSSEDTQAFSVFTMREDLKTKLSLFANLQFNIYGFSEYDQWLPRQGLTIREGQELTINVVEE